MSCMLFSDRQRFVKRFVMMHSDMNYFVTGKTRIIGKMTAKFSFFSDIYASYVANLAETQLTELH